MVLLHSQYYSTFTDQFINYTDQGSIKLFLSNVCIENTNLSGSTSNCSVNLLFNLLGLSCFAYFELGSIRFTGYQLYSDTSPSGECSLDCAYDGLVWIQTLILHTKVREEFKQKLDRVNHDTDSSPMDNAKANSEQM